MDGNVTPQSCGCQPQSRSLRSDAGSTMVTALIVMLVLSIGAIAIAGMVQQKAVQLERSRSHAIAQSVIDYAANTWIALSPHRPQCGLSETRDIQLDGKSYPISIHTTCADIRKPGKVILKTTVNGVRAGREITFDSDYGNTPHIITRNSLDLNLELTSQLSRPYAIWVLPNPNGSKNTIHCHPGLNIKNSIFAQNTDVVSSAGGCKIGMHLYADNISLKGGTQVGLDIVARGNLAVDGGIYAGSTLWGQPIRGNLYVGGNFHGKNLASRFFNDLVVNGNVTIDSGLRPIARGGIAWGGNFTAPGSPQNWTTNSAAQMSPPFAPLPVPPDTLFWPVATRAATMPHYSPILKTIDWTGKPCNGFVTGEATLWERLVGASNTNVYSPTGGPSTVYVHVIAEHCNPLIFPTTVPNGVAHDEPLRVGGSVMNANGDRAASVYFFAKSFLMQDTKTRSLFTNIWDGSWHLPAGLKHYHSWHLYAPDALVGNCSGIADTKIINSELPNFPVPAGSHPNIGQIYIHTPCRVHIDTPHQFSGAINAGTLTGNIKLNANGTGFPYTTGYSTGPKNFRLLGSRDLYGSEL